MKCKDLMKKRNREYHTANRNEGISENISENTYTNSNSVTVTHLFKSNRKRIPVILPSSQYVQKNVIIPNKWHILFAHTYIHMYLKSKNLR